jgi:inorganic triphosphatase YgiF
VFTTAVTRKIIELNPTSTTEIAVAIDCGEIRAADGAAAEPISEIELELKRGDPADCSLPQSKARKRASAMRR